MATTVYRAAFLALAIVTLCVLPAFAKNENCVYNLYVRTGTIWKSGTDSTISVEFYDAGYNSIFITNLTGWGGNLQGQDRDYFEGGNLDIFSGLGDCLDNPICGITLTSDGEGDHHGWYVDYVEVTFTGAHLPCYQKEFEVNRWLATDAYPFSLTYDSDECADVQNKKTIEQGSNHQSAR